MKKLLLFAASLYTFATVSAQTLTASTNNPVVGDVFCKYICDTAIITVGAAGTGVTWDESTLIVDTADTVRYMACGSTPYCGSFPASNLVKSSESTYDYLDASPSSLEWLGFFNAGYVINFINTKTIMSWPLSYGSTFADFSTFALAISGGGTLSRKYVSTFQCDGSGMLKLPGGLTYSDVLRVHTHEVVTDSTWASSAVGYNFVDQYDWYVSGFHSPLLTISYDSCCGEAPYVTGVSYYKKLGSVGVNTLTTTSVFQCYPNPAADVINIRYNPADMPSSIVITDLVGSNIATITDMDTAAGVFTYNTTTLPAGVYVARMHTANGIISQKFTVAH